MKTHDRDNAHAAQRQAAAQQAEHGEAAAQLAHVGSATFEHRVNHSPRMVAQRRPLHSLFGEALQLQVESKNEAPAQIQATVQRNGSQAAIDRSPRMLGQGRALDAAFGRTTHRESDGLEDEKQQQARIAASAPLQRVGRGGHIAIGAAIGSIIPVIGTAIGGYIGHRIFNKKQRRPARGQREGEPQAGFDPLALQALQERIFTIRDSIQNNDFQEAADALSDRRAATLATLGLHLDLSLWDRDPATVVEEIADRNMYYPEGRRIAITMPATFRPALATFWTDDPARSRKILFMALEEFMHAYQDLSNSFSSPATGEYKSTNRAQQAAASAGAEGYDYDEIDVMAAYQDWGEDVQALGYVNRYAERKNFHQWRQDRQTAGYRFKDALALN